MRPPAPQAPTCVCLTLFLGLAACSVAAAEERITRDSPEQTADRPRPPADDATAPAAAEGDSVSSGSASSPAGPSGGSTAARPAADESAPSGDQEPPRTRYREEITVRDRPSLTTRSPERAAHELATIPGGADFVDAERYLEARVSTLKDALDFTPGVFVQPRFGSEEARLSVRGSGLQRTFHGRGLKLLQDGVPLNLADGGFDFQAVEPLAARYVEVLRGANGLEQGSSTLGGAINFLSRTGFDARPLQGRVEAGSFGYLRGQASAGGTAGDFDYFASLTHFGQDGFRDHAEQSTQRLFSNLGYRLSDGVETRFYTTAVATDSELPGSLTRAQLAADPSQAAPGNVALDQKRDFDLLRLASKTTWLTGRDGHLDLSAYGSYKHLDHPIFQVFDQLSHDVGAEARYESGRDLGGRPNRLVVGLAPAVGRVDDERFENVGGERGDRTAQGTTTSTNVDLYADDRLELRPGLALSAGVVLTFSGRDFDDRFPADGDQTDERDFFGWSPRLGLLWQASPEVALFANLGRSFEPPTFGELTNVGGDGLAPVDEQTATTVEVGSRGAAGRLRWDAVLYHAWLDGELLSLDDAQGNPLGTINADRTVHAGAEVRLDLRLLDGGSRGDLTLRGVYTWSRFTFDGDPTYGDNRLAGLPEHFLRAELAWRHPSGFYAAPHLERVPSAYPVDHANTLFSDPYSLVGARFGHRGSRRWSFFLEGRNLTDETYAATTGVLADARGQDLAQFLPGDGRSVYAGVEVGWGTGGSGR